MRQSIIEEKEFSEKKWYDQDTQEIHNPKSTEEIKKKKKPLRFLQVFDGSIP
jgi:hypothetical protein